jgi:glycosyltransferase involved in cell wall biosynthesis
MKLLHVIQSVNPAHGGPIEGVRQIARIYADRKIEADLVSLDLPDDPFVADFPLKVYALGPGLLGKYGYSPRLLAWLRQNHHNYDCVIVHGIWQYHSYACWRAVRKTKTPYVVFTHGMLDPWFKRQYPLKHLKKSLYWPWHEYRVLRDAKAVLFTSEEERILAGESFRLYRVNPFVVGYGTRIPNLDLDAVRQEFFTEYPHLRHKRLAIFIGRIHPKKGCDLLIGAFHQTVALNPDWHLLMVGPDQLGWQAELQQMCDRLGISDRITWTGMLRGERKWGAIAASEIFVLPSHQENFGIVVAEALAGGVPALISTQVNIWREIRNEHAGFVEQDTLAGAINLFLAWSRLDDSERAAMRTNSRRCFEKHFDLENSSNRFLQLMRSLAQQGVVPDPQAPVSKSGVTL